MRETELGKMKKGSRLLDLNLRFAFGEVINKKTAAADYQVNERTVQRDIETIRNYYAEKYADTGERKELVYNRALKGYQLTSGKNAELTGKEVYAISKILLESKAFTKEEMLGIQEKLMNTLVIEEERNRVKLLYGGRIRLNYLQPGRWILRSPPYLKLSRLSRIYLTNTGLTEAGSKRSWPGILIMAVLNLKISL